MRWTRPTEGTHRIVKKFAWLPTHFDNTTIWFEHYYEVQRYRDGWSGRHRSITPYPKYKCIKRGTGVELGDVGSYIKEGSCFINENGRHRDIYVMITDYFELIDEHKAFDQKLDNLLSK